MGFTDLLSRLPSCKALPISHYDDEFVVASIDRIQNILSTKLDTKLLTVNSVDRPTVAVNTNPRVNTIPSGNENSSDVIGQNQLNSSLVLLNLKIIAAIISCIAQSIKICHNNHSRTENCTTNCQPVDNSKFNFKRITFSDKVLLHFLLLNRHLIPPNKKKQELPMDKVIEPLLIIPEEHNIALKFTDDRLPPDHADLLRRYKADLNLPNSPIRPENHCSKKLLQIMTREDTVLWDLIETIKRNRPMGIHGTYMKNYTKDLHVKDELLFLDNKLVVPATIRGTFNSMLHETHPGQFGMKFLAEYLWWPHTYREIYHHGRTCTQCLKAGKNIKVILGTNNISKLPTLTFANEEINLDFAGPLDASWGNNKYILLCIDRYTKFPSAKIVNNTSTRNVISFLNDYCHLHGFPRKIRVDHGSCFLSRNFKNFCDKFDIGIIYCTVGDHRSNGLVERLVHTIKTKLLAMSFEIPKPSLSDSIEKIIWNLRISKQTAIGCTPFEKHFNRVANTRWKNLMSNIEHLDKGKAILSKERATNWELHDGAEDGYLDEERDSTSDPEENLPLARTFSLRTTPEDTTRTLDPLGKRKAVTGGNLYRKVSNRKNGDPYFNLVKKDIIDSSEHTITLDNGHVLRKSDLAIKGKILPGPKKILVNRTPTGHNTHIHSSLAGKRKLSPPKKAGSISAGHSRQGTPRTEIISSGTSAPTASPATQDSLKLSSGSSSLNLDSWDGIIEDYFDDVTNNNVPQMPYTETNQGLSITGHAETPPLSSEGTANNDSREIVVIHDANTSEGSQDNPIMIDSIPEQTTSVTPKTRNSRPRRNVGPPQFYGNRRFIDVVQEKDDLGAINSVFSQAPELSTFSVNSPSDLLTPLAEAPPRQISVAETTLSWSSRNSLPMADLQHQPRRPNSSKILRTQNYLTRPRKTLH